MDDRASHATTSFLDEDIDFDTLLDDEPEQEATRRPLIGPRKTDPYRPVRLGRGNPNWSRIGAAAFVALVVLFILGFIVISILGARKAGAYRDYFAQVGDVTSESDAAGKELANLLSQPTGADRAQLVGRLEKLEARSRKLVSEARGIKARDEMQPTHDLLVQSLQYRENGLVMLRKALTAALTAKDEQAAAAAVAEANLRLAASDVIYADSYATNARRTLIREEVTGVTVPESRFVADPELTSPGQVGNMLERLRSGRGKAAGKDGKLPEPTDGKVHGGQLGAVTVSPSGETLSTTTATEIAGSENVAFEVPFENQGEVQETQIPVKVTLRGDAAEPQELTAEIESVNPGEVASVRVPVSEIPTFGETLEVCVEAGPVPGEKTVDNNAACYQVTFKL